MLMEDRLGTYLGNPEGAGKVSLNAVDFAREENSRGEAVFSPFRQENSNGRMIEFGSERKA